MNIFLCMLAGILYGLGLAYQRFPFSGENMTYDNHCSLGASLITFAISGALVGLIIEINHERRV
jgi:hypothetical protein